MYLCAMSGNTISQNQILEKLGIEKLNPMQEEAHRVITSKSDIILLSPTGTGKTVAFMLPIISELDPEISEIQALIVVPTRELAQQIEQVSWKMGTGFKINAVFGGRSGAKDKIDLKHRPAILIGTPGRIADHLRRESFPSDFIKTIVLDEFDKSLEIGFESDMSEIMAALPNIQKRILTSASQQAKVPTFVGLERPTKINYLDAGVPQLKIKMVISPTKDKRETLLKTLCHLGDLPGIIFCNFKDTIQDLSDFLTEHKINHGYFHGGMEQLDRERALIKFRNGTFRLLIATDLGARGIDVPEIKFIIHYEMPPKSHEFTHRNGRTARMSKEGTAYILKWEDDYLPDFIENPEAERLEKAPKPSPTNWTTLHILGGKRDQISKGDIVGLFIKQGKLEKDELGIIEIQQDCAYVGVLASKANKVIPLVNNSKLKKKKIRVSLL